MAALVTVGSVPISTAQDDTSAFRDLATGTDFRIRVSAALVLGKSRSPGARPALEKALGDPHPAVRAAAAAGLGSLGDGASLAALRKARASESTPNVQAQIDTTMQRLSGGSSAPSGKAKFLVSLGRVENKSGAGAEMTTTLKDATRARMAKIPGVEVLADGTDLTTASKSRRLPGLTIDASLIQLIKKQSQESVSYSARVEYLIRREQTLKGTISGNAQALAESKQIRGHGELAQLQIDAIAAAIDNALKNAPPALEAAVK